MVEYYGLIEQTLRRHLTKIYKLAADEFTLSIGKIGHNEKEIWVKGKFRVYSEGSRIFNIILDKKGIIKYYDEEKMEEP